MATHKLRMITMFVGVAAMQLIGQPAVPGDSSLAGAHASQATLSIRSSPSAAECYIDKKPGTRTRPDGFTPTTLEIPQKPNISLTLFKKGYSDTTILLQRAPAAAGTISVSMIPLHVDSLVAQNRFLRDRFLIRVGRCCLGTSPLFLAAGAGSMYYGKKNKKKADKARLYRAAGLVSLGVGAVDLGAGIILYF